MNTNKRWRSIVIAFLVLLTLLPACAAPAASPATAPAASPTAPSTAPAAAKPAYKFAMVLPGPIQDGGYNTLGYIAVQETGRVDGIPVAYSESVAVSDAAGVARQYAGTGFNIIAFHGAQFLTAVQDLSKEFPNSTFIIETGGPDATLPSNVWNMGRKYDAATYPVAVLAAKVTKSKKVGWIAGVQLPNWVSSVNLVCRAVKATDPSVLVSYVFTGDQNDPVKARQAAEAMIEQGVDVIIPGLDNGIYGVIEAARNAKTQVLLSTYSTDKSSLAPNNFMTAVLFDYKTAYIDLVSKIMKGQPGGYYEMVPGKGIALAPFHNVSPDAITLAQNTFDQIGQGTLKVAGNDKTVDECP